jgi:hypothetical protein
MTKKEESVEKEEKEPAPTTVPTECSIQMPEEPETAEMTKKEESVEKEEKDCPNRMLRFSGIWIPLVGL